MPAVMVGLDADLHFMGPDGEAEIIGAQDFFINAAKTKKIFTHAAIQRDPHAAIAYRRVKKSPNVDIPLLSLLIKTNFSGDQFTKTTVSVNNCVTFAQRDTQLEEFLNNSRCSERIAEEALDHIDATIYDNRSSDYKKHIFRINLKSALNELVNKHTVYDNPNDQ
jgi:CO/xanthine dehydrogenase FAD-binding subunit